MKLKGQLVGSWALWLVPEGPEGEGERWKRRLASECLFSVPPTHPSFLQSYSLFAKGLFLPYIFKSVCFITPLLCF